MIININATYRILSISFASWSHDFNEVFNGSRLSLSAFKFEEGEVVKVVPAGLL